ncbi:MAG: type II toxin-antitoxin system VapC family toxin [Ktedonobacterales bacterium]
MNGKVVVDTSIALKWVVVEADSDRANALLGAWQRHGVLLIAPTLLTYEVANILRQRQHRASMSPTQAETSLRALLGGSILLGIIDQTGQQNLGLRALELADLHHLAAAYDAHFLALAEREGCEYWTADERLWNTV